MTVSMEVPLEIQAALAVLTKLSECQTGLSAGQLRQIALLNSQVKPSQRDAVLEGLRTLHAIMPYGGSGRGRSYMISTVGQKLLEVYRLLHST